MTHLAISPIRKRKLYEEIVERIEGLILDGSLALGEQLPSERELMTSFAATPWQVMRTITLPTAVPYTFTGIRLASSLAEMAGRGGAISRS